MRARLLFLIFSLLPALTGCYLLRFQDAENLLQPGFCDFFPWLWYNFPLWVKDSPLINLFTIIVSLTWWAFLLIRYEGKKAKTPMMFTLAKDTIIAVILSGILAWALPTLGHPLLTTFHTQFGQQGWIFLAGLAALILIYYLVYVLSQQNNSLGWTRFWKAILVLAYAVSFISLTYASPSSPLFFVLAYLLIETYVICLRTFHTSSEMPKQNDLPDAFGRQSVVDDCINRLRRSNELKEPCNIALTGKWGSGKTFTMREVFQRLKNGRPADKTSNQPAEEPTPVLYINPWHLHSITDIQNTIIEGIYHTIRPRSCFSFPPLFKLLRHLTQIAGEPHLSHCYDALTELIKTPGSLDTTSAQLTLNAAIQQPIVIFLDDLERVQPEVLKQIFPLLDCLSAVTKLHFFVAINTETLDHALQHRSETSGYFHKVFMEHIELPQILDLYYNDFVHKYLKAHCQDEDICQLVMSLTEENISNKLTHISFYHPKTPRTLIHSICTLISLCKQPLAALVRSPEDHGMCKMILCIYHFCNCIKEEYPDFYYELQAHPSSKTPKFIEKTIKDNSSYSQGDKRNISETCPAYEPLRFLLEKACIQNGESVYLGWQETDFSYALDGKAYSFPYPTIKRLLNAFTQSQSDGKPVHFNMKPASVENSLVKIFWKTVINWILEDKIPESGKVILSNDDDSICKVLNNSKEQIRGNSGLFVKALVKYVLERGSSNERFKPRDHNKVVTTIITFLPARDVVYVLEHIDSENDSHASLLSALTGELNDRLEKELDTFTPLSDTLNEFEALSQAFAHIPETHMPQVLADIEVKANNPKHILTALAVSWDRARRSTYYYLMEPEKGQKRYLDNLFYQALRDAFPNKGTNTGTSSLQRDVTNLILQCPDYKEFFKSCMEFPREGSDEIPEDRQQLLDELKAMLNLVMPKPETGQ